MKYFNGFELTAFWLGITICLIGKLIFTGQQFLLFELNLGLLTWIIMILIRREEEDFLINLRSRLRK